MSLGLGVILQCSFDCRVFIFGYISCIAGPLLVVFCCLAHFSKLHQASIKTKKHYFYKALRAWPASVFFPVPCRHLQFI